MTTNKKNNSARCHHKQMLKIKKKPVWYTVLPFFSNHHSSMNTNWNHTQEIETVAQQNVKILKIYIQRKSHKHFKFMILIEKMFQIEVVAALNQDFASQHVDSQKKSARLLFFLLFCLNRNKISKPNISLTLFFVLDWRLLPAGIFIIFTIHFCGYPADLKCFDT